MQLTKVAAQIVLLYCSLASCSANFAPKSNVANSPTPIVSNTVASVLSQATTTIGVAPEPSPTTTPISLPFDLTNIDIPSIVNQILALLSRTGLVNSGLDLLLSNPTLLQISIDATIAVLKSGLVNLTDLFIALNKSGMIPQILELSLSDPEILPGLLRIGKDLLKVNGINIFNKRDLALLEEEASFANQGQEALVEDDVLTKRENQYLNSIFALLSSSGLATSVIQHLLTSPNLAYPAAQFLNAVLRSGAISPSEVIGAVKESNMLPDLFKQILSDKALLSQFANLVSSKISSGIISQSTYDSA